MLDRIFWHNSVKSWMIAGAIILGSLIIGRILVFVSKVIAGGLKSKFLANHTDALSGPTTTLLVIIATRIASESLELPTGVRGLIEKATTFLAVVVFTWGGANAYDSVNKAVFVPYAKRPETAIDLHIVTVMRTIVNVLIWVVGVASALNSVGFEVSAILAGLGIGGMALGLASQDTVSNLFGGVLVLTQRPFKVGDRIEVAGVNGWVHQFGLRNTIIKNWYGRDVLIPNKKFTDSIVVNIDAQTVYYQEVRLRIDPRTNAEGMEKAVQILNDIVRDVEEINKNSWVMFDKIEHGFFEIEFWYEIPRWTAMESAKIPNEYEKICRAKNKVNLEILKRFETAGIRLAVPVEMRFGPAVNG